MKSTRDQALGFAGLVHFANVAHQTAADGVRHGADMGLILDSVLCTDPRSADDIFGDLSRVARGREIAGQLLSGTVSEQREAGLSHVSTYVGHLLRLGSRVHADAELLNQLAQGLAEVAETRAQSTDADAIRQLAELYTRTISRLSPRILINGLPEHLRDTQNVALIRSALLAGVRCAVLWRQSGGRVWSFVLRRQALLQELARMTSAGSADKAADDSNTDGTA